MKCEKCQTGTMQQAKVFRLSGCLVAMGFTLLFPSLIIIVLTSAIGALGIFGGSTTKIQARPELVSRMQSINGMIPAVVEDFKDDGEVSEQNLGSLSDEARFQADKIIKEKSSVDAIERGGMIVVGGTMMAIVYFIFLPALIIGFLLVLRKKVWKCNTCGYLFERG